LVFYKRANQAPDTAQVFFECLPSFAVTRGLTGLAAKVTQLLLNHCQVFADRLNSACVLQLFREGRVRARRLLASGVLAILPASDQPSMGEDRPTLFVHVPRRATHRCCQ